jgi:predicted aspartyl protease
MKNRLWLALFAAFILSPRPSVAGTCPFRVAADLPVSYVGHHSLVVTVAINGIPLRMQVDTGSYSSYLSTEAYDKMGSGDAYDNLRGYYAQGVAGTMQMNSLVMRDLAFGSVTVRDKILFISDSAMISRDGKPLVDGLLGEDILQQFDIGLDLPNNHIILYDPPDCAATEPPWAGSYAAVPITRHPETLANTVDYGVGNATLAATIDTGSETSVIFQSALARAGVTPEAVSTQKIGMEGVGNNVEATTPEKFSSITIGGESFGDMWVVVAPSQTSLYTDALIGEDYLGTHRVFIANSSNTVFFYTLAPAGN